MKLSQALGSMIMSGEAIALNTPPYEACLFFTEPHLLMTPFHTWHRALQMHNSQDPSIPLLSR